MIEWSEIVERGCFTLRLAYLDWGLFMEGLSAAQFTSGQKLRNPIEENFNQRLVKKCLVPVGHWEKQFSQSMMGKREYEGYACPDDG